MKMKSMIEVIGLKFKSGNSVPVSRAVVTKEEWEQLLVELKVPIADDPVSTFAEGAKYEQRT